MRKAPAGGRAPAAGGNAVVLRLHQEGRLLRPVGPTSKDHVQAEFYCSATPIAAPTAHQAACGRPTVELAIVAAEHLRYSFRSAHTSSTGAPSERQQPRQRSRCQVTMRRPTNTDLFRYLEDNEMITPKITQDNKFRPSICASCGISARAPLATLPLEVAAWSQTTP